MVDAVSMRPRIADLFCGAGGVGMGLHRAGFEVVGYDLAPQPNYPFEFHQQDALDVDLSGFDAVWASPPCQFYSRLRHLPWLRNRIYWRSIPPTREYVLVSGLPYIIENVEDARWDMENPSVLCGMALGMPLYRHRAFESPFLVLAPPHVKHTQVIASGRASLAKRRHGNQGFKEISRNSSAGHVVGVERIRKVMGIDWMTRNELAQAIPPAYSEFLGEQLMTVLQ